MRYVEGDLFAGGESVFIHGCNSLGRFGSGFAGAVKARHPAVMDAYRAEFSSRGLRLGDVHWVESRDMLAGNCITQASIGRDGRRHVDYDAVRSCMRAVNGAALNGVPGTAFTRGFGRVAMPMIGADLAGGDWAVIASIIDEELTHVLPVVYYLPGKEPVLERAGVRI